MIFMYFHVQYVSKHFQYRIRRNRLYIFFFNSPLYKVQLKQLTWNDGVKTKHTKKSQTNLFDAIRAFCKEHLEFLMVRLPFLIRKASIALPVRQETCSYKMFSPNHFFKISVKFINSWNLGELIFKIFSAWLKFKEVESPASTWQWRHDKRFLTTVGLLLNFHWTSLCHTKQCDSSFHYYSDNGKRI